MGTYLLRRLLLMVPTLLGMTVVVFFAMALSPGGLGGRAMAAGNVRGAEAARVRAYYEKRYHINEHPVRQYLRWLNLVSPIGFRVNDDGAFVGFGPKAPSLGESMERHRPVSELIAEALPVTLLLNLISLPLIYATGILAGVRAARNRGGAYDVGFGAAQLAAWSIPTIWLGVVLIGFLANREYLKLFPTAGLTELEADVMPFLPRYAAGGWERGWLLDVAWHLVLPIVCMALGATAFLSKLVRGSVLENLAADYARTARAKGLPDRVVLYRHVFRNSLLSLITVAATVLPSLFAGSIVIETIFSIPGMGRLTVQAAQFGDREVVLAGVRIFGTLSLASALLRDVLYAVADPRVTYD